MDMTRPRPTPPRIVIVEDDLSPRAALVFALAAEGFQARAFGQSAPLLSDGDGLALVSRLREKGVCSPAILTTTNPDARVRHRAEALGVQIVEKPLITGEFRRRIDELVARTRR
jgi:DNA-binding response OmpR family regulator